MKNVIAITSCLLLLTFITACDDGTVSTTEVLNNCSQLSGTYSGSYNNYSCKGTSSSDTISNFTITNGCTAEIEGIIVSAGGSITNIDPEGNSFNVRVDNPPNSDCGGLSGYCERSPSNSSTYYCSYVWDKGGNGTMNITRH
ncbi:MAG: hypothetical protein CSA20_00905 [Deltaproteobacteria bacterium]|nr:MAG: hypothetical protein CSA20_00905 [Deltaproteobacteria bacterium]